MGKYWSFKISMSSICAFHREKLVPFSFSMSLTVVFSMLLQIALPKTPTLQLWPPQNLTGLQAEKMHTRQPLMANFFYNRGWLWYQLLRIEQLTSKSLYQNKLIASCKPLFLSHNQFSSFRPPVYEQHAMHPPVDKKH